MVIELADRIDLMDLAPFVDGREQELYRALREGDPLHWNPEPGGGPGFWSLTRYEDVRAGLSDHVRLASGMGTQISDRRVEGNLHSLHNMDPPRHGKLRRVAIPYLRQVKVREWEVIIQDAVARLLDDVVGEGEVDFVDRVSSQLPVLVLGRVLGVPREDCPKMVDWTNRLIDPEYANDAAAMDEARSAFIAYFRDLVDTRRRDPQDDLVSLLAHGMLDGEPLGWDDIEAYLSLLVAAGNETTRNTISGTVVALHRHPEAWEALRADRSLLPSAVEEMLRWVTPLACMRRTATEPIELHGKTIRPGDKVVLWFASANYDPSVFPDPERFLTDRFLPAREPEGHLALGWGIHFCMGAHLARAELSGLFGELLRRDLSIRVTGEPVRLVSNMFRGYKSLPARVDRAEVRV